MLRVMLSVMTLLVVVEVSAAQAQRDACHVYVIDVEAARRAAEEYDEAKTAAQRAKALSGGVKILGEFTAKVGEEELTTVTYPFPDSSWVITASVYYTDEMMRSKTTVNSMLIGIVVADVARENAISAENNTVAEVTYNQFTDTIRVKSNVKINGRAYLVGLQCNQGPRPTVK